VLVKVETLLGWGVRKRIHDCGVGKGGGWDYGNDWHWHQPNGTGMLTPSSAQNANNCFVQLVYVLILRFRRHSAHNPLSWQRHAASPAPLLVVLATLMDTAHTTSTCLRSHQHCPRTHYLT
jgi:hypothetical protein